MCSLVYKILHHLIISLVTAVAKILSDFLSLMCVHVTVVPFHSQAQKIQHSSNLLKRKHTGIKPVRVIPAGPHIGLTVCVLAEPLSYFPAELNAELDDETAMGDTQVIAFFLLMSCCHVFQLLDILLA